MVKEFFLPHVVYTKIIQVYIIPFTLCICAFKKNYYSSNTYTQNRVHFTNEALANALVIKLEAFHFWILGIVAAAIAAWLSRLRWHVRNKARLEGATIRWSAESRWRVATGALWWRISTGLWHRIPGHRVAALMWGWRIAWLTAIVLLVGICTRKTHIDNAYFCKTYFINYVHAFQCGLDLTQRV